MQGRNSPFAEKNAQPRYQPLIIVLAATAAGIALDRYFPLSVWLWMLLAGVLLAVWLRIFRRNRTKTASFMLLFAVASASAAWHHCRWNDFAADDLGNFATETAEPVCLEAVALDAPRESPPSSPSPMQVLRREPTFRFEIAAVAVRDREVWKPISGRAILTVIGAAPKIQAGDRLKIFGKISAPDPAHNPGEFDYAAMLRAKRIRALVQSKTVACVSLLTQGSEWNLARRLDRLRIGSGEIFKRFLDPDQAELASAVLLGEREHVEPEQTQAYMATGTIHVLSISGLHVGVLAGGLLWLMRFLPLPTFFRAISVAVVTGLYVLMVDVQPPVVRATILVLLACGSQWLTRNRLGFNSLAAAGLAVLAINPCDLFSVGAQLSFLSVAVLIWFGSRWIVEKQVDPLQQLIEKNYFFTSIKRCGVALWEIFLFGLAIWLVTTPLVMARFHLFSPSALVMNALLWLPMTVGLLAGFALLFCGTVCPPAAYFCGFVCNLSLSFLDYCVRLAETLPGSHFWVAGPNDWWLAAFYGGLAIFAAIPKIRPPLRWCVAILAAWIAVGFLASLGHRHPSELRCTFVSVGHGSATVLELPSGQTLLCDAGRMGGPFRAAKDISGVLWSRGITHLDAVAISHPDIDHYNALPELLKRFSVGAVYVSPGMFLDNTPALKELKASLARSKIPFRELRAGQTLPGGTDCRIEVLHPPRRGIVGSHNANSLVLSIDFRGRRILLPGDLEDVGLKMLLAEEPLSCEVLLAPHHGSRASNSPALAAWSRPRWVVLSGDGRWSTPETAATYRAVGGQALHTHYDGAVLATINEKGTKVEGFMKKK
jgi:competence protein ComEC